jgi:hypothetical protein
LGFQDFIAVFILSFRQKMLHTASLYCYAVVHLFPTKGESETKVYTSYIKVTEKKYEKVRQDGLICTWGTSGLNIKAANT